MAFKRYVAIVGSSGGGGAAQSGSDVYGLLVALKRELAQCEVGLAMVQLVECSAPLDFAASQTPTVLWTVNPQTEQIERSFNGTLDGVNERAQIVDRLISRMIIGDEKQRIDGLISISSDPDAVNQYTFLAAAKTQIPVVGTGGTSLGKAAGELDCNVVGNSGGSVSTTIETKALSFTASLAGFWKLTYEPSVPRPRLNGILGACLPAFVAVAIANKLLRDLQGARFLNWWTSSSGGGAVGGPPLDVSGVLPVLASVITASQVAQMGETAALAGVVAGVLACSGSGGSRSSSSEEADGTVLGGIMTGWLAGWLCRWFLVKTARSLWVPATASSIITAGATGLIAALVGRLIFRRPCAWLSEGVQKALFFFEAASPLVASSSSSSGRSSRKISVFQWLVALVVGPGMTYGSQVGGYHLVFLPLILFEMEKGQPSFLGAVDWCSLCLISGGITTATWLLPLPTSHPSNGGGDPRPLAKRGAYTNLMWGDFVEACYPFFQGQMFLTGLVYLASWLSTALLLRQGGRSSAYLPVVLSWWLGSEGGREGENEGGWECRVWWASLIAFGLPFVAVIVRNGWVRMMG
ncbi:pts sugar transporter [Nannochloropsis oceanica]